MTTSQILQEKGKNSPQQNVTNQANWLWWATAVLLLAALMRLAGLADIPPGLAQDEVLNADVVSFIRQGAHSLFFREGYGHEPLYHYWSVPFQVLLGDNVLSIRLPAAALGILLVAATMRWAKRSFTPFVGLAAGLFLAISWWPIIFSRVGLRPIMEPLLLLFFAYFWPRRPWLAGLFLGLSLYTYTGARVIFLWPVLLALYWLLFRKRIAAPQVTLFGRSLPQPFLAALISLLVAAALYLPLALTLRADPSLQQRVQQLEGPLTALGDGNLAPIVQTTLATLGVFSFTGDPRWTYMIPGRPLFDPLTAIVFYAGLFLALWRFKRPPYAFVLIWLLVGLLPSAITPEAPSTIRLVGAMPAVYTIAALALGWLWDRRGVAGETASWARAAIPILIAGIFLLNLGLTVTYGFLRWPQALETRLKYQSLLVDVGDYVQANPGENEVFADGFYRPITADSLRRDMGSDPGGRWVQTGADVSGALVLPAGGNGRLFVPEYATPAPLLFEAIGQSEEPGFRSDNQPSFAVYDLPREHQVPSLPAEVDFENLLSLVGYEISTPQAGQALQIVSVWRVNGELPKDLAIFVHWMDDGDLIAQHDGLDAAPNTLRRGDMIIQRHVLPWPSTLQTPAGSLNIGLYLRESGRRLAAKSVTGETADYVPLSPVSDQEGDH